MLNDDNYDRLWIVLPTETWRKLFNLAIQTDMSVNDYLQALIEQEAQSSTKVDRNDVSSQIHHA